MAPRLVASTDEDAPAEDDSPLYSEDDEPDGSATRPAAADSVANALGMEEEQPASPPQHGPKLAQTSSMTSLSSEGELDAEGESDVEGENDEDAYGEDDMEVGDDESTAGNTAVAAGLQTLVAGGGGAQAGDAEEAKKPALKLKLKVKALAPPPTVLADPSPAGKSKMKSKAKSKGKERKGKKSHRRKSSDEEDELVDPLLDDDDEEVKAGALDSDSDDWNSDSGGGGLAHTNLAQMTARQRAKEFGENMVELHSLPMTEGKGKKEKTEADRLEEKAEKSRRRKHQSEKKLEDEKTETINRLLKKQVGKTARNTKFLPDPDDPSTAVAAPLSPVLPPPSSTMLRWVSSNRSGEYVCGISVPEPLRGRVGILEEGVAAAKTESGRIEYPGPRPPPKTRRLR